MATELPQSSLERALAMAMSPDSFLDLSLNSYEGLADLTFAVRHGRTRLVKSRVHPPLAVQRALYLDNLLPDMAFVFVANPTAGIFQGDHQRIAVEVQTGARAHVTNQSATKIHAMPDSAAYQYTNLAVADNSYLEYLPEPLIPFRGSRFRQETRITVSETGSLLYSEITTPGRVAHGEMLDYDWLDTRLTVSRPESRPGCGSLNGGPVYGELIYHEAYRLGPNANPLQTATILGKHDAPTLGSLMIITAVIPALDLAAELRTTMNPAVEGIEGMSSDISIGATCLPGDCGVGIKVISPGTQAVKSALTLIASASRRLLIGSPLPPPPKILIQPPIAEAARWGASKRHPRAATGFRRRLDLTSWSVANVRCHRCGGSVGLRLIHALHIGHFPRP